MCVFVCCVCCALVRVFCNQMFGKTTCWSWEVDDVVRLRFGAHDAERGETVIEGGIYSRSSSGEGVGSKAGGAGERQRDRETERWRGIET